MTTSPPSPSAHSYSSHIRMSEYQSPVIILGFKESVYENCLLVYKESNFKNELLPFSNHQSVQSTHANIQVSKLKESKLKMISAHREKLQQQQRSIQPDYFCTTTEKNQNSK